MKVLNCIMEVWTFINGGFDLNFGGGKLENAAFSPHSCSFKGSKWRSGAGKWRIESKSMQAQPWKMKVKR